MQQRNQKTANPESKKKKKSHQHLLKTGRAEFSGENRTSSRQGDSQSSSDMLTF